MLTMYIKKELAGRIYAKRELMILNNDGMEIVGIEKKSKKIKKSKQSPKVKTINQGIIIIIQ